ncbi:MAG: PKD domain-containing protein, partial [Bacteroidetes bacterium]|nr:PKD domain-containing protein [Bacteroidota bacterium]
MKRLLLLFFSAFAVSVSAQYTITSGGTINTCSGTFTAGSYTTGTTYTMTVCSDGIGTDNHISIFFPSDWNVASGNQLCVYDGTSTSAVLIGCYDNSNWGTEHAFTATPANLSGCLTFVFTSTSGGSSWTGEISCNFSCQPFYGNVNYTDPPMADAIYTNICQGQTVTFSGIGDYYVNDTLYHQSDGQCEFVWGFGDGTTATGQTVTHTFPDEGGYNISLIVTDQFGCVNLNDVPNRIRVSTTPVFAGTNIAPTTICQGESVTLNGVVTAVQGTNEPENIVSGTTYLPDGDGDSYSTSVNMAVFDPGQVLEDVNDLLGICANIEHSFIGDLIFSITCPNGTQVILEDQGGGGVYLGVPNELDDPDYPGTGWDYCWTPNPTYGVMSAEAANYSTLPPGDYASFQPLTGLVGCPLNGNWTITVTDNWLQDDGFIFWWGINFDPSLYPDIWYFTPNYDQNDMLWTGSGTTGQTGSTVTITPAAGGNQSYVFTATDEYGCSYDTTLTIYVDPNCCTNPTPNAGPDQTLCGDTITLNGIQSQMGTTLQWTYTGPGTATFTNPNSDTTFVTVNPEGDYIFTLTETFSPICVGSDAVTITFLPETDPSCCTMPYPDAGQNQTLCGLSTILSGTQSLSGTSLLWTYSTSGTGTATIGNPSSASTSVTVSTEGTYIFTLTEVDNVTCTNSDAVTVVFYAVPAPNAGPNADLCAMSHNFSGTASVGSGIWTYTGPGTAAFSDPTSPTSSVTVNSAGEYVFTYTETNGQCTAGDNVTVEFSQIPQLSFLSVAESCYNSCNGSITVSATGATTSFTQIW